MMYVAKDLARISLGSIFLSNNIKSLYERVITQTPITVL
jgi:hypothetical protein